MEPVNPASDTSTIANGASLGGAIALGLRSLFGLLIPASWTTAAITFAVSLDGTTFVPLYDVDGEVTIPSGGVVSSTAIALDPVLFAGWSHVKPRSGTSGSPVTQSGAKILTAALRETL